MASSTIDNSPAESFLSTPGDNYSSLFATTSTSTMNPMDMMTPSSTGEEKPSDLLIIEEEGTPTPSETSSSDKKPTKKRKSWGQVLPEPKTNLPPRKRAKTEDEKEQRRVERVLRNRRAAQSSRERKRLEVEALEERNKELESKLHTAQQANLLLLEELNRFRRSSGVVTHSSSPLDSLRDNPVTLSHPLFGSTEFASTADQANDTCLEDLLMSSTNSNPTVNPATLSPEPQADSPLATEPVAPSQSGELTTDVSPDLAQHPAAMLDDLQCHKSAEMSQSFPASRTSTQLLLTWSLQFRMMLLSASAIVSACQRPLTQIALSSKAGFSLLPSPQLLTTIIWLVTLRPASQTSTSTTSSTTPPTLWQRATAPLRTSPSTSRSTTLRLKSLRKILSSSPNLARPLLDATMVALRLVSDEEPDCRDGDQCGEGDVTRDADSQLIQCLRDLDALPSKEVLVTLLWVLTVEIGKEARPGHAKNRPAPPPPYSGSNQSTIKYVLKRKKLEFENKDRVSKRYRFI